MGWFLLYDNMNQPDTLMGDSLEAGKATCGVWVSRNTLLDVSSPGARWQAICLQQRRRGFDPWVGKSPWKTEWQPTPVLFSGKSSWQRSPVGHSPWGRKESDLTEWPAQQCASPQASPPSFSLPSSPREPQAWFLHLGLRLCFVHKFIYTDFFYIPHICDVIWYFSFSDLFHSVWQSLGPILIFSRSTSIYQHYTHVYLYQTLYIYTHRNVCMCTYTHTVKFNI